MKITKTIIRPAVPARQETITEKIACDICGGQCEESADACYSTARYAFLACREYESYPDSGRKETEYIDLCVACYEKVKQVVKEKWPGVCFNTGEIDW